MLKTVCLIFWKNLLLRKKQWVITFFELFFPMIFVGCLTALTKHIYEDTEWGKLALGPMKGPPKPTYYYESPQHSINWYISSIERQRCIGPENVLAYAPVNWYTSYIMSHVKERICKSGTLEGFQDEAELEENFIINWLDDYNFTAAVVFPDGLKALSSSTSSGSTVEEIPYTIRMPPHSNCPNIRKLFPRPGDSDYTRIGPNEANAEQYLDCGFLGLQISLDLEITNCQYVGNCPVEPSRVPTSISFQPFPYPAIFPARQGSDVFKDLQFLIVYLGLAWGTCFLIPSITRNVVAEKQTGISELLRLTGVPQWLQWVGWLAHILVPQLVLTIPCMVHILYNLTMLGGGSTLELASSSLVFVALLLVILASVSFAFLICALTKKPTVATTIAEIIWMIAMFLGLYATLAKPFSPELTLAFTTLPNFSLAMLVKIMINLEWRTYDDSDKADGIQWSLLERGVDNVSLFQILLMLVADMVAYFLLAVYLDGVLPSEHGIRKPWYYFTCERNKKQDSMESCNENELKSKDTHLIMLPEGTQQENGQHETGEGDQPAKIPQIVEHGSLQDVQSRNLPSSFEPDPVGAEVGVEIQNIYKKFGPHKTAVNGVSLKMFTGDIFALLGHNGAGKTTLISMLTGFFAPTSGTAIINGYDIRNSLENARKKLGFCPQNNMIFNWLSVSEQLCIFGMLRGLNKTQADHEARDLMVKMNLYDKSSTRAINLSGGQLRKLSLGIALIGGTKVVVLDEPMSGMDPQARREIWDLLLQLRGQRTILLTTHFMEEADVLGDRIAIMANGQLQCCGSPAFLKKYFGTGYTLKLTLMGQNASATTPSQQTGISVKEPEVKRLSPEETTHNPEVDVVLAAVQKHIPNASLKSDVTRTVLNSNEVFLCLPGETATTTVLSKLFADLVAQKEKLKINTMGLSQTTMDEVFVRVGAMAEKEGGKPIQAGGGGENQNFEEATFQKAPKRQGSSRVGVQFLSLLQKKYIYSTRKWIVLIFQMSVPLIACIYVENLMMDLVTPKSKDSIFAAARARSRTQSAASARISEDDSMPISLDIYEDPVILCSSRLKPWLVPLIGSSAQESTDVVGDLLAVGDSDRVRYKRKYIVAFDFDPTENKLVALFNMYPYHAFPLAVNLATNLQLKDFQIRATSKPFSAEKAKSRLLQVGQPEMRLNKSSNRLNSSSNSASSGPKGRKYFYWKFSGPSPEQAPVYNFIARPGVYNYSESLNIGFSCFIALGLLILLAHAVVAPIEENICKVKQLQTMTGVSPLVYWGAAFTWDYLLYFFVVCIMLIIIVCFELTYRYIVFLANYGWLVFILITMTYGFSGIFFSYVQSLRSSSVAGGFSLVTFVHLLTGLLLGAFLPDPDITHNEFPSEAITFVEIFRVIGRFFPSYSFVRAMWYYADVSANNSDCGILGVPTAPCPTPETYLKWSVMRPKRQPGDKPVLPTDDTEWYECPHILQELLFLVLNGLMFLALLMLKEYRICRRQCVDNQVPFPLSVMDEDVFIEVERVNELVATEQVSAECLVVQGLCKNFGSFVAVSQLSFGVHHGECFGLLGVNGAGKTTAFRIITGDEIPTHGDAFGFGTSLDQNPVKFFGGLGYCPQFDAILVDFTGKEMLQLFAGLRGIPFGIRGAEAMRWLTRMGLQDSAHAKCGRYSGGMQRRLSMAMAMIGEPNLILLDEPTSGVDPVSRRQFWKILDKLKAAGQSVILTSHSMEECEALCSRLGIMVNGQFQCFGGVQHLKNKFAQGYSLTLKLKQELSLEHVEDELKSFEDKIIDRFMPCQLKDKHQNLMQFHLQNPSITWDELFKSMEELKAEHEHLIEDYSVNETSLEEVFLAFARLQYPERRSDENLCKQICTCSC